ncbi:zeatin O-glucosyltransferase-like [Solanum lycopersicum]|uniref:zeatin O-glucosyltransferase-like n=1 Tax=Solanum lycopersicum TaxID=4081 RepID=UPI000276A6FE|nr:zeatin O-glucosyltransferase-like [Solanum lycopersicum]
MFSLEAVDTHSNFPMAESNTTKSNDQISVEDAQVAVVMVPLPAQGHLNQLLHLSRLITSYNIPVHYVGATTHIRQAKLRVHGFDPVTIRNLHFHEFPTPPFENPPPNPNASHKFPDHMLPLLNATIHFREPVCSLVNQLLGDNHRRVIVIYDSMMTWVVQDVPAIPNAEGYRFNSFSAFYMCSSYWETKGKPSQPETEIFDDIISSENCAIPELWELWNKQGALEGKICSGELYNSSRVIEGLYLDLVAKEINGLNLWAIGPFNPLLSQQNKQHQTLYWLDKQETNSVIYVSFGSTTTLSNEEIEELAIGLEKSMQKFIWVLREADKGDIFAGEERRARLPEGYEERIKGRGIIVRDWAPQLEILAHPSTGGFMSHCGWNSCMESISMGVPIAAWPMHSDQPRNSQLITKVLKTGLTVRHWARRDELVASEIVENVVRTLMTSPEGDEMRKRASELSIAVKKSVMDGEGYGAEMNSFIAHITR